MDFRPGVMREKANDLLAVSRSQPFVRVRKAIRQAADPTAAVGIEV
jgi:hypothetical protein